MFCVEYLKICSKNVFCCRTLQNYNIVNMKKQKIGHYFIESLN